jgi:hypothetical protein
VVGANYDTRITHPPFFAELGTGDHLILGISDTTPPAADYARLKEIARRAEAFGPVRPGE